MQSVDIETEMNRRERERERERDGSSIVVGRDGNQRERRLLYRGWERWESERERYGKEKKGKLGCFVLFFPFFLINHVFFLGGVVVKNERQ